MVGPFCGYVARTHPAPTRAQGKGMKPYIFFLDYMRTKTGKNRAKRGKNGQKCGAKVSFFG